VFATSFGADSDGDPTRRHTALTPVPDSTGPSTVAAVESGAPVPSGVPAVGHAPVSTSASVPSIAPRTRL
jgi:hypothetical protein